jgi:hypothetical protein
VQHIGPDALKVACPCQLEAILNLLLGKKIDWTGFHSDATIAWRHGSSVAANKFNIGLYVGRRPSLPIIPSCRVPADQPATITALWHGREGGGSEPLVNGR